MPDYHLRIAEGRIVLDHGPRHNFSRPAVDTLFTSAAATYGPRVIGVVLTGGLDDGTAGLMDIKRHGGVAIVQDPKDAVNPSMPSSARECVPVDYCIPLSELGGLLKTLAGKPIEAASVERGKKMPKAAKPELSTHICPECNGPMWSIEEGKLLHYHCRIGHSFSGQSLLVEKSMALESALWSAVNALKDKADISLKLAKRANGVGLNQDSYYSSQAKNATTYAKVITDILLGNSSPVDLGGKRTSASKKTRVSKTPKRVLEKRGVAYSPPGKSKH